MINGHYNKVYNYDLPILLFRETTRGQICRVKADSTLVFQH